jgi:hypothetical protein
VDEAWLTGVRVIKTEQMVETCVVFVNKNIKELF